MKAEEVLHRSVRLTTSLMVALFCVALTFRLLDIISADTMTLVVIFIIGHASAMVIYSHMHTEVMRKWG